MGLCYHFRGRGRSLPETGASGREGTSRSEGESGVVDKEKKKEEGEERREEHAALWKRPAAARFAASSEKSHVKKSS